MNALRAIKKAQPTPIYLPDEPTDIAVHMIHRGRVGRGTVSTRLPHGMQEKTRFFPGSLMPFATENLEAVRRVATRCVPWVQVVAGPLLWSYNQPGEDLTTFSDLMLSPDGRVLHEIGGQAWSRPHVPEGKPEVILLSVCRSTSGIISTLHHEIWHIVEHHVAPGDFGAVDAVVEAGHAMPGAYLDSSTERRARVYQAWANAHDEGWRPVSLCGIPVSRVDRVFLAVYRGDLAADIAAGCPAPERLFPGEKTVRVIIAAGCQVRCELGWQGILLAGVAMLTLARWI